ncbi:hypothetical protein DP939_02170 [Spongiactinospora rosea]|uniref:Uncharacterized protein n=1 Tax=Spongiactinospora rosea TaxID=2248750 RepID=A0A366M5P6_9ACTN|nr:hypothetical protein [Spongiactinospora rosea]RBQ21536.1 hypothetical protein DP939_02170 [Spongiactinospora rosea]
MAGLPTYDYGRISPHEIRHELDDRWSKFYFGDRHIAIARDDLERIRDARRLAQVLAAQAGMWDADLAALEERAAHVVKAGPPATGVPADEPYGGDDPALDARVTAVMQIPETHRREASE